MSKPDYVLKSPSTSSQADITGYLKIIIDETTFFGFLVKKEFAHVMRDRKTLLILFGLPVMQVLIFGFLHLATR